MILWCEVWFFVFLILWLFSVLGVCRAVSLVCCYCWLFCALVLFSLGVCYLRWSVGL